VSGIRIARKDDLEGIVALMEKYYEYDRHDFDRKNARRVMRRLLADPVLGRVFLAADKNSAIGYLALTFGYSLEYHGRDAFVDEFFILKIQRQGARRQDACACRKGCQKAKSQGHPSRSHEAQ
jgi:hypothetical protein